MPPKKPALADALAKAARGETPAAAQPEAAPRTAAGASPEKAKTYRAGRVNVTGYFDPAVKQSLRLIQSKHPGLTVQDLLAEALDDLFAKYNVPQTARVKPQP